MFSWLLWRKKSHTRICCLIYSVELCLHLFKTHWGRVTHKCVSKLTIIGSDNGLSPGGRQAIIWTNAGILFIQTLGKNFSEILGEIHSFSFLKIHLKMSSAKWRLFGLGLNELMPQGHRCVVRSSSGWMLSFDSLRPSNAYMRHQTRPSSVQVMASRLLGTKPLSEPILVYCQLNQMQEIILKKMNLIMPSVNWWPFCFGLIVLMQLWCGVVWRIWCISELGRYWFRQPLVACSVTSHYLNQCWPIVSSTFRNKLQWNFT